MLKFNDILQEVKKVSEAIKAAKDNETRLVNSYMELENLVDRHNARKANEAGIMKNTENIQRLELARKILRNNAKVALFNEVLPVALSILAKYAGKPYGEKTKEKISDEIKEKTNCLFYISSRWGSHSYEIYPVYGFGNYYNISCGTEYTDGSKKPLLVDNKIQLVTFEEIALYYISREYVENIPGRIEELKRFYAEAVAKQKELAAVCDRFNALAVGDIEHIYSDKRIYPDMKI